MHKLIYLTRYANRKNRQAWQRGKCGENAGGNPVSLPGNRWHDSFIIRKLSTNKRMETSWYSIEFDFEGIHYQGRVTPETKKDNAKPSSWHVVLNEVFFGYVHKDHATWLVSEQRPAGLVQAAGKMIEQPGHVIHMS